MSVFNFSEIKDTEALIFYKNGISGFEIDNEVVEAKEPMEVLKDIETIDQLLILQKSKSLLNKKRGLRELIGKVIQNRISNDAVAGTNNNHLV